MRSLLAWAARAALPGLAVLAATPALAAPTASASAPALPASNSPFNECDAAIATAVKPPVRVPDRLVPAIARVESGRLDPATGRVRPWPWTINVEGTGYFYDSKEQVISAVQAFQAKGVRSIDVGCMQVNLMHHPKAFAGLDEAFDPEANARYAVKFLTTLYQQLRDWNLATAWYHSADPDRGEEYQRLVFGRVMTPMGATGVVGALAAKHTGPYASWPPPGTQFAAIPPMSFSFAAAFTPAKPGEVSLGGLTPLAIQTLATSPNFAPAKATRTARR